MILLDGKKTKLEILKDLKSKLEILNKRLGLAVIQIGEDPASSVYVNNKAKMAKDLDYKFLHIHFKEDIKEEDVLTKIDELNNDDSIDGILVQMPIPKHLNSKTIQNSIHHLKDVDGLTDINM